jgi:hypothetical protein
MDGDVLVGSDYRTDYIEVIIIFDDEFVARGQVLPNLADFQSNTDRLIQEIRWIEGHISFSLSQKLQIAPSKHQTIKGNFSGWGGLQHHADYLKV